MNKKEAKRLHMVYCGGCSEYGGHGWRRRFGADLLKDSTYWGFTISGGGKVSTEQKTARGTVRDPGSTPGRSTKQGIV